MFGGQVVGLQRQIPQLSGALRTGHRDDPIEGDVLVVGAEFGLGRRGEQRLIELAGLDKSGR